MHKIPDRNAHEQGSGPTEAGSALGPDWHEGIVLRGAEQVTSDAAVSKFGMKIRIHQSYFISPDSNTYPLLADHEYHSDDSI